MSETTTLGADFAQALAAKDFDRVRSLFAPAVEFRGLTPRRFWEASDPDQVVTEVLRVWFEDSDEIESLEKLETDVVADRQRVAYRFRVRNPEGLFLIEQQVYLSGGADGIEWMRVLCSGFREIEEA